MDKKWKVLLFVVFRKTKNQIKPNLPPKVKRIMHCIIKIFQDRIMSRKTVVYIFIILYFYFLDISTFTGLQLFKKNQKI